MDIIKKNFANILSFLLLALANFTVNSACYLINYQDEEPTTVKCLKKIKDWFNLQKYFMKLHYSI